MSQRLAFFDGSTVPQGFSHCCSGQLFESDRQLGQEHFGGWLWGGRNAQTATQTPRQAAMMKHIAVLREIGFYPQDGTAV